MRQMVRRFSWLSFILASQILILPLAQAGHNVAVLELQDGQVKAETVEKVTDTLRDQLALEANFSVVPKASLENFFASHPDLYSGKSAINPLGRYIEQAQEFYKNVDFKSGIAVLENVIATYRGANPVMSDRFQLVDVYLMLGNLQMGDKKPKEADASFREAVRLDPEREITEEFYPPRVVAQFSQSKAEALKKAKTGRLEIFSSPDKADVYINGVAKGTTPLKLENFTSGEHFVLVEGRGSKPLARKITVKDNYTRERFELAQAGSERAQPLHGVAIKDLNDVGEQVRLASAVGSQLHVDKLVWVSVQEIGYNHKITARMIDLKYQASHKQKSVEVLDLPKDTRPAAQVIAKDLSAMADLDLAKDPKKFADSEVLVIGKKKHKSIWKSPWLWGGIGALVAGGAAGAFLIGRGGDDKPADTSASVSLTGPGSARP